MNVLPFVHEGLGNSSYLVELGDGEAALVDPDRTVDRYLRAAEARGWQIVSVFETHLHADFVSGAREVAHATGASIFLPEGADSRLPSHPVAGGGRVQFAGLEAEAIASAGHTPEHLSYIFRAERKPPALFSGGALIVGGAARTDLISPEMTEPLTRAQYRTVTEAFRALPDETLLFPTHGGGSFCSAGAGGDRVSTLGKERAQNPLLSVEDEDEFVGWFPLTFPAVPAYFFRMRAINQAGPRLRGDVADPPRLSPAEFEAVRRDALVVDVRPKEAYMAAHVPGALSNAFRDPYALWLGWLVQPETTLLFVTGDVPLQHVIDESLLVGYERFAGWLDGGMEAWTAAGLPFRSAQLVDAATARKALLEGAASLDVREPSEFESGHIEGAIPVPLGKLQGQLDSLPKDRPLLAYCAHGDRAATAVSILERAGFGPLLNLNGGINSWMDAGYQVTHAQ